MGGVREVGGVGCGVLVWWGEVGPMGLWTCLWSCLDLPMDLLMDLPIVHLSCRVGHLAVCILQVISRRVLVFGGLRFMPGVLA